MTCYKSLRLLSRPLLYIIQIFGYKKAIDIMVTFARANGVSLEHKEFLVQQEYANIRDIY
jgi:hypothetical protein